MNPLYPESPAHRCQNCGVEVADSVLEEHKKSAWCKTRGIAYEAERSGLVRCNVAMFDMLSAAGARVSILKTGLREPDRRKIMTGDPVDERWADSVAVEIVRHTEWPLEARIRAVENYVAWRKKHPRGAVRMTENGQRVDSWCNSGETSIAFRRGMADYDGTHRYGITNLWHYA